MRINKHDTQGTKPLLGKGELGYDDYQAGGDTGRVYVGTGTENIPVAKKSEVMAVDGKADAHIARVDNPHGVTKAQVGLDLVDNTADASKNVLSATKWTTARTITLSGDIAGSASVDGSANVTIATTVQPNSVALGTDTTGNYVAGVTAGTGISISGTAGEGWSPTITNTAPNVTTNITTTHNTTNVVVNSSDGADGTINGATQTLAGVMTAADKVKLDGVATGATANVGTVTSIATSGAITGGTITSTGTISHSTADGYLHVPATGTTNSGKVLTAGATAGSLSWTALPSAPVTSVAGKTGDVTLVKGDVGLGSVDNTADSTKNVLSATKLTTARTINGVSFDGTADIVAPTNLGITAGTTAGPIVTSSTGTNATLPTASASASGVVTTGNQTWAGVKTFSSNPISTATQSTAVNALTRKDYVDSLDVSNVKLTGDQTIAGVKTFSSNIVGNITGNADSATTLTGLTATVDELNKIDGFTGTVTDLNYAKGLRATGVTTTEFDYLDGVTSDIQTQLNAKAPLASPTFTGTPKIGTNNITSISTAVTDNTIARYDGTTGKLQDSGVVIDDSDNIGVRVTPSAWTIGASIDISNNCAIYGDGQDYTWDVGIVQNGYQTGANVWEYKSASNQNAGMYRINGNQHEWRTAPLGSAGNPIPWTNAMTLGANGNLLVGTTTNNGVDKLQVNGSITSKSSEFKYSDLNNACTVNETTIVDNTCLNIPYNDYGYVSVIVSGPNTYCMQTFTGLNAPASLFIRVMAGGNWSAWVEK